VWLVNRTAVAIIGAGPYGLSLAAHLASRGIENRIFGHPMQFWSEIADAGGERYLKSFCFGTNISTTKPGFTFSDYSRPRGLETFEPCSIKDFADYGRWFQTKNVTWAQLNSVALLARQADGFILTLDNGERCVATRAVVATGLVHFAHVPPLLASLPPTLVTHTSNIDSFAAFKGRDVAIVGGGQSALEAGALLYEFGARPQVLVRESAILWQTRTIKERSLWGRLRSPLSGLGSGPIAWGLTNFPGAIHRMPRTWRTNFVRNHLPAEGAWWLRERVMNRLPVHRETSVIDARPTECGVKLLVRAEKNGNEREIIVDHVIAGTGYVIDLERLGFLDPKLSGSIQRLERAPRLNAMFESSVSGLYFIGPASALSFGPLFRFVVGAEYTARTVSAHLASAS
jgi:hypothetical protein